jgi:hypothetical protein
MARQRIELAGTAEIAVAIADLGAMNLPLDIGHGASPDRRAGRVYAAIRDPLQGRRIK